MLRKCALLRFLVGEFGVMDEGLGLSIRTDQDCVSLVTSWSLLRDDKPKDIICGDFVLFHHRDRVNRLLNTKAKLLRNGVVMVETCAALIGLRFNVCTGTSHTQPTKQYHLSSGWVFIQLFTYCNRPGNNINFDIL